MWLETTESFLLFIHAFHQRSRFTFLFPTFLLHYLWSWFVYQIPLTCSPRTAILWEFRLHPFLDKLRYLHSFHYLTIKNGRPVALKWKYLYGSVDNIYPLSIENIYLLHCPCSEFFKFNFCLLEMVDVGRWSWHNGSQQICWYNEGRNEGSHYTLTTYQTYTSTSTNLAEKHYEINRVTIPYIPVAPQNGSLCVYIVWTKNGSVLPLEIDIDTSASSQTKYVIYFDICRSIYW